MQQILGHSDPKVTMRYAHWQATAQDVLPLVQQALVLGMQFDTVVANPSFRGVKGMNPSFKDCAKATFPAFIAVPIPRGER